MDLETQINNILGPVMGAHIKAKRLILVLEADGPAWATQVVALEKQLTQMLTDHLPLPIAEIEVRVRRSGLDEAF
jgi:hypothetical protein